MIIDAAVDIMIDKPARILSNKTMAHIRTFATNCASTNNYVNMGKIQNDILVGKMAEIHIYKLFAAYYPGLTLPDFAIYQRGEKSWEHDLSAISPKPISISVKGQDILQAKKYDPSWVFSRFDKSINITNPNHFAAFCIVDPANRYVELKAVVNVNTLTNLSLFSNMKIGWLNNTKKCVYEKDLIERYK